jgi:hypothetical protein
LVAARLSESADNAYADAPRTAASIVAMSILVMFIIAANDRVPQTVG